MMLSCSAPRHEAVPATHTVTTLRQAGSHVVALCADCAGRYERIRAGSSVIPPAVPLGAEL